MKKIKFFLSIVVLLFLSLSCKNSEHLFQENANNWFVKGDANWSFANNELIGALANGGGFVITNDVFKDFVLELEFFPDSTINSGVFIRCEDDNLSPTNCYEINIWDAHPNQDNRTGSIVNKFVPLTKVETINKWNTYKIKSKKTHIQIWVNGFLTVDLLDKDHSEGAIGLQAKGSGKIKFRKLKIKEL